MHVKKWLQQDLTRQQASVLMRHYLLDLSTVMPEFYTETYEKFVNSEFPAELELEMEQTLFFSECQGGIPIQNYGVLDDFLFVGCDNRLASKVFRMLRHFVRQEHLKLSS
jgi:hypothetical protein